MAKNRDDIQTKETEPHGLTNMLQTDQQGTINHTLSFSLVANPIHGKGYEDIELSKVKEKQVEAEHLKAKKVS